MFQRFFPYLGKYKKNLIFCFFLVISDVICELMMPLLMSKIVDNGIPQKNIRYISFVGITMVALALASILFGTLNMKFSAEASQGFAANLRESLFNKVQSFSFANIDHFSTASLVTRLTSDTTQMQVTVMMCLRILLRAPMMLVCAMVFAISINARLSVIIFIAIPILVVGTMLVVRTAERLFTTVQKRLDGLNGTIRENLIAIRVVKAFVRARHEKEKFKKANNALTESAIQAGNLISLVSPIMMLVLNGATLAVIWFGGKMVGTGSMGTGQLLGFISYLMQIMISTMMFSMIFILFARSQASGARILEVLDTEPDIRNSKPAGQDSQPHSMNSGKIEFRNVDFRYNTAESEGKNVLSDINFTVEPGEITAIIGGTGSGKSTMVNLIPRLYDTTCGQVLVDDTDVRNYDLDTLRSGIGMVLQKNVLFSGTIRENLLWGCADADNEKIKNAAEIAQAHEFIEGLPDGYETVLGEGGVNVSGGQKQRLCIARAILKNPRILILDDSTSAVDTATEAKIREAFRNSLKNTTVLIIAQRISSVKDADKIIVLDDGKISGIGTHEELYHSNDIYREICNSQQEGLAS
jgi:ATP-binding cassette subfamily B protein